MPIVRVDPPWLRYGLDAYPKDAEMLKLGAQFEQARGDSGRAAEYYRASLKALPPADPGAELAAELSQPMPVARLPKPVEPQDLATLLRSSDDRVGTQQNAQPAQPYLPSFGNVNGQAPVEDGTDHGRVVCVFSSKGGTGKTFLACNLAAAIANHATHLVTGDRRDFGAHFGKQLGGVLILPPRDYFESRRRKPRRPGKKR